MKKLFVLLFLAAGASAAMAQSQIVFSGSSSFRATLPEFSYNGKAQIFTKGDLDENGKQTFTFYSDDFTKQRELTINPVEYEYYSKYEERAWEGGGTRGYTGEWQVINEDRGKSYSGLFSMELNDFDQGCAEFGNIYISQTMFNSDDKYEYLMPIITTESGIDQEDRDGDGVADVRITWTSAVLTGVQVVSETGAVLQTINFPDGFKSGSSSKNDIDLIKINGKLYLSFGGYDANGSKATLLCSIGIASGRGAA